MPQLDIWQNPGRNDCEPKFSNPSKILKSLLLGSISGRKMWEEPTLRQFHSFTGFSTVSKLGPQ